jgi:hypothetical protein
VSHWAATMSTSRISACVEVRACSSLKGGHRLGIDLIEGRSNETTSFSTLGPSEQVAEVVSNVNANDLWFPHTGRETDKLPFHLKPLPLIAGLPEKLQRDA